ncbi:YciI family protein [Sporolactobacillus nakayamae]|uniref:YCII-related domain-containing protein n=1 Tax=Sporolactobacillus nakayamae TaxID=269670 RepID=A0A1I2VSF2_9BACL|nr:YciI family protein [Sporolactobacillus nakayamae]SFG92158.1 YCII-related domain-containing protein [Sporolactobacillus nakayamae]
MPDKRKQYIYVLRLIPALLDEANWTKSENDVVEQHFSRLQELLKKGMLILAGKTEGLDAKTFGIVILETSSFEEAQTLMQTDPAVAAGIMTAELYPYRVALMRSHASD